MPREPFEALLACLSERGAAVTLHEHAPARTMDEARDGLDFEPARIVKTIAFALRDGRTVLAALRGTRRVDYAKLAGLLGVSRRDLSPLSPEEVLERTGVAPGGVSPLPLPGTKNALRLLDSDVLCIAPTLYCGSGRADRTIELAPLELVRLCGARVGEFSR